jgi:nucleotide-binding universal stress UspA family protein
MYQHILIPTDGSELAGHGVTNGLALAKSVGAKVTVIMVQEAFNWHAAEYAGIGEIARHGEEMKKFVASELDRVANAAREAGVPCDTIQVEHAQPYRGIIAAATNRGCDLIVMASHGRGGLSAVVLGSVTNKVLTHTKIPVLVCR